MLLGPRFLGGNPLAVKPEEGLDAEVNDALDTPSLLNMSSTCCNSCVNRWCSFVKYAFNEAISLEVKSIFDMFENGILER